MKIGVFGDFENNSQYLWPALLKKFAAPHEVYLYEKPNASEWNIFLDAKNYQDSYDVMVVIHTDYKNLPNRLNLPLTEQTTKEYTPGIFKNILERNTWLAGKNYYQYLINEEYHLFTYNQLMKDYDKLKSKIIHLFKYEPIYRFQNGITLEKPLVDIPYMNDTSHVFGQINNRLMAFHILNTLDKNNYNNKTFNHITFKSG